jgi:(S)-ureidoglycine aminohydrolase
VTSRAFPLFLLVLVLVSAVAGAAQMGSFLARYSELRTERVEPDGGSPYVRRDIAKGETLDLAELAVEARTIEAGAAAPPRVAADEYEELMIVKSGTLAVRVEGRERGVLGPGSVVVCGPGEERGFENVGDLPATYYLFTYRGRAPADTRREAEAGGPIVVDWNKVEYVPSDIGGRRQMFDRSTAMFDDFEMHVSTLNEGLTNHPAHTHRAEEFVLIIDGEVEMRVGDDTIHAQAGDLIYLESMIPHSLNNVGKGATTYFAFQYRP